MEPSFFEIYFGFRALSDVFSIFLLSLISTPIVRWAYNWNRDFGWYYPLVFLYIITPIIILLIKKKGDPEKTKIQNIPLSKFILYYIWVNVGFVLSTSIADVLGYVIEIGVFPIYELNIGMVFYLSVYCLFYSNIRKKYITLLENNISV